MTPSATSDLAKWYGAAAASALALAAAPSADAQVVYTDIDDVDVMDTWEAVAGNPIDGPTFDLTGDNGPEFLVGEASNGVYTIAAFNTTEGEDTATGFIGNTVASFGYFLPLAAGDEIGPASPNLRTDDGAPSFTFNGGDPNGFQGVGDVYIGLQFQITAGTTHYAWVRVEMPTGGGSLTVKDFAFEATPDTPIAAGAMGVATEPGALADGYLFSEVAPNPIATGRASFRLAVGEAETVSVDVFDSLGRRVQTAFSGALVPGTTETVELDTAGLPSGVYVVRVSGESFVSTRNVTVVR